MAERNGNRERSQSDREERGNFAWFGGEISATLTAVNPGDPSTEAYQDFLLRVDPRLATSNGTGLKDVAFPAGVDTEGKVATIRRMAFSAKVYDPTFRQQPYALLVALGMYRVTVPDVDISGESAWNQGQQVNPNVDLRDSWMIHRRMVDIAERPVSAYTPFSVSIEEDTTNARRFGSNEVLAGACSVKPVGAVPAGSSPITPVLLLAWRALLQW